MKKILALILISAFLLCLIPFSVSAKSDGFEISGVDTTPKPGAITVLTPAYSKDSTGMSSDGKIMEIVVRSDVITSTESVGNTIPDDGYDRKGQKRSVSQKRRQSHAIGRRKGILHYKR